MWEPVGWPLVPAITRPVDWFAPAPFLLSHAQPLTLDGRGERCPAWVQRNSRPGKCGRRFWFLLAHLDSLGKLELPGVVLTLRDLAGSNFLDPISSLANAWLAKVIARAPLGLWVGVKGLLGAAWPAQPKTLCPGGELGVVGISFCSCHHLGAAKNPQ